MKLKFKLPVGVCLLIGLIIFIKLFCNDHINDKASTSVFDYNKIIFNPYLVELEPGALNNDGQNYEGMQENKQDYINYYIQSVKAINYMIDYKENSGNKDKLIMSEQILENLKATYERWGNFPRPAYQNFEYGWVSSMDAPTIMLASQMLFELTGNEKWEAFVSELSEYISKDVKEGGFTVYFKNSKGEQMAWPLEYAEKSSTVDNSEFVLNGSLVGYLGIQITAGITDSDKLYSYTHKVKKAYTEYFIKYHYKDYDWTYYMLNPLVVNQPHYMIFEKQLFNAIKEIDNDPIFKKEYLHREKVLKNVLKPQFKNRGGGYLVCDAKSLCASSLFD